MSYRLSPSRINLFFECKRCFWLRVREKAERPSKPFPSLPNGIDRTIKEYFDDSRQKGQTPSEIEEISENLELFENQRFLDYARSWNTEPKWHDSETGAVLRGGVDDLLKDENGDIVILDFKTKGYPLDTDGGKPDYYSRQVNLYNLILEENGYKTADYGLLLYFYPESFGENGGFRFKTEHRKVQVERSEAKKWVRNAVETLQDDIPEHDEDCDYSGWQPEGNRWN